MNRSRFSASDSRRSEQVRNQQDDTKSGEGQGKTVTTPSDPNPDPHMQPAYSPEQPTGFDNPRPTGSGSGTRSETPSSDVQNRQGDSGRRSR